MNKRKKYIIIINLILFLIVATVFIGAYIANKNNKYVISFTEKTSTITLEYGDDFSEPVVEAYGYGTIIDKKKVPLEVSKEGNVDTNTLGSYEIKYTASFKDITDTITLTVNVADTTPPVIELVTNPDSFTSPIAEYQEEGFSASDNYDGDITDKVNRVVKDGIVTYTVLDSSGNETVVTRKIVYKDVVPPTISLLGTPSIYILQGSEYKDPGITASDDVDGDITSNVKTEGNVDTNTIGSYSLTYTVSDSSGNSASATRQVNVYQKQNLADPIHPGDKVVYLTFDDGPYAYTGQLLDILDKYNVKATFFVTNQYPEYQYMIAEEAKRGHTVAIHTYSHRYEYLYSSETAYYDDLNQMKDIIIKQTGIVPNIVRFPGGTSNTISRRYCNGIMTTLASSLTANGYYYSDWNVSSGDAGGTTSTSQVAANVIAGMQRNNVSIVLQHDIKSFSVNAVEQIIQWGLANGYSFLPMTETTPMVHQGINN